MATIVIEDGSQVAGANSYATEAELTTYATDRGVTISGTASVLLVQAMDYIESRNYQGFKASSTQPLVWPRYGVMVDGYQLASDEIPQLLKDAQLETAISIDSGDNPTATIGRTTKREKLGDLELEYADSASAGNTYRAINSKLSKLLVPFNKLVRT